MRFSLSNSLHRCDLKTRVSWPCTNVDGVHHEITAVTKNLIGHVDNAADPAIAVDIDLHLTVRLDHHGPVPVIVEIT